MTADYIRVYSLLCNKVTSSKMKKPGSYHTYSSIGASQKSGAAVVYVPLWI